MDTETEKKKTIIFLCVANSARSQIAEGLARSSAPPNWDIYSAGSEPAIVHPLAIEVLSEMGIDISDARSKGLDEVPLEKADFIATLCAEEACPVLPKEPEHLNWAVPDPAAQRDQLRFQLETFRATRDEIKVKVDSFWAEQS